MLAWGEFLTKKVRGGDGRDDENIFGSKSIFKPSQLSLCT